MKAELGEVHGTSASVLTTVCNWVILGKRTNDNWSVLCVVTAPVERRNQEKTFSFEKGKNLLHQDNARGTPAQFR